MAKYFNWGDTVEKDSDKRLLSTRRRKDDQRTNQKGNMKPQRMVSTAQMEERSRRNTSQPRELGQMHKLEKKGEKGDGIVRSAVEGAGKALNQNAANAFENAFGKKRRNGK